MAWDLSRTETLPFGEVPLGPAGGDAANSQAAAEMLLSPGPLDGITRNLAITGLGS
jgi:error-prone DNA polymerase